MTNQQLKAHCEDVIANPQGHSEMVLAMAKALLSCLEAVPVGWTDEDEIRDLQKCGVGYLFKNDEGSNKFADPRRMLLIYADPPMPELKPIELPEIIYVREPGFIGYVYDANEIEEALKRNGIQVKS
jgi:hypothetical protein